MMSKESIEVLLKRFKKSNRIIGITTSLLVLLFAGMSLWDLFHGTKVFIETELFLVTTIVVLSVPYIFSSLNELSKLLMEINERTSLHHNNNPKE